MHFWTRTLASALLASGALAQSIQQALSFGQKQPISSDGSSLPGWVVSGQGHTPQLLSDRVVLTPIAPGGKRGALWAKEAQREAEWTAEVEFRATGQERGSGNFGVWLAQKSEGAVSLYTAGKFDGLVLVVDQYGGRGGSVRGFLNDGSKDYKTHHSVDQLAFGKCDYSYRNRGVYSKLRLQQGPGFFEVKIDDKVCFRSDNVKIPIGYYFGVTAASAETADSFEVAKFTVTSGAGAGSSAPPPSQGQTQGRQQQQQQQQQQEQPGQSIPPVGSSPNIPNSFGRAAGGGPLDANTADLLQKLTPVSGQIETLNKLVLALDHKLDEVMNKVGSAPSTGAGSGSGSSSQSSDVTVRLIHALESRLQNIESTLSRIQNDVEGKEFKDAIVRLQGSIQSTQQHMLNSLPESVTKAVSSASPSMGFFIFVILAFQVLLVVAYVIYKRRRANTPKKFL